MKRRSLLAVASSGFMLLFLRGGVARAAELKVSSALAAKNVMADMGPMFQRATAAALRLRLRLPGQQH